MGRRHKGREIHGILPLDKPPGLTSNQALQRVKRWYNAAKAGHTGTLDLIATGMLPLCFGEATGMSSFLLDADKGYRVGCTLGVTTTTGDCEGEVCARSPVPTLSTADMEAALQPFLGEQMQVPPMHSAVHYKGQRLYKLARKGLKVKREPRRIVVYTLQLLALQGDSLELELSCSKGTYVRTLVTDLGERLGCGAHVHALRRLWSGPFHSMISMSAIAAMDTDADRDALLLPVDQAIADKPSLQLTAGNAWFLCQGQSILVPDAPTAGLLRLYSGERFLGVGSVQEDGRIHPQRIMRSGMISVLGKRGGSR